MENLNRKILIADDENDILEIISEYDNKARERHIELNLKGIEKVSVTAVH